MRSVVVSGSLSKNLPSDGNPRLKLSRRTLTRMMELLETVNTSIVRYNKAVAIRRKITVVVPSQLYIDKFWSRKLFEHGVEEWVISTSEKIYQFKWDQIIRKLE